MCSTPFGIMEGITAYQQAEANIAIVCSTPFGIMEGITRLVTYR